MVRWPYVRSMHPLVPEFEADVRPGSALMGSRKAARVIDFDLPEAVYVS